MNPTQSHEIPALGFCMQGMGEAVARVVDSITERFDFVTYLEVGVGHGDTLAAVANMLREANVGWRVVGVDLPEGYSLNMKIVSKTMNANNLPFAHGNLETRPRWNMVSLFLADSQVFLRDDWCEPIHLALIDGCHGKPCVMNDFLHIEPWVVPGGVVMFHDFGQDQVGDEQPHCPTGIDVQGACYELGLLDNARRGWHFNQTLIGDKAAGSADMGVFQKT